LRLLLLEGSRGGWWWLCGLELRLELLLHWLERSRGGRECGLELRTWWLERSGRWTGRGGNELRLRLLAKLRRSHWYLLQLLLRRRLELRRSTGCTKCEFHLTGRNLNAAVTVRNAVVKWSDKERRMDCVVIRLTGLSWWCAYVGHIEFLSVAR
jgi:hypothetical protein